MKISEPTLFHLLLYFWSVDLDIDWCLLISKGWGVNVVAAIEMAIAAVFLGI